MRFKIIFLLAIPIGVGIAFFFAAQSPELSDEDLLEQAHFALGQGDLATAVVHVEDLLKRNPDSTSISLLAAEVYLKQQRWNEALDALRTIGKSAGDDYLSAQITAGEIYRNIGKLSLAEKAYFESLQIEPNLAIAHQRLAFTKRITGRIRDSEVHLRALLDERRFPSEQLAWLAAPDQVVKAEEFLLQCHALAANDPLPMYGLGMIALNEGRLDDAEDWLTRGCNIERHPEALASLGRCHFEQDDRLSIQEWLSGLQESERSHSSIQYVLGLIAERSGNDAVAIRHYIKTLQVVPDHQGALNHLATLLDKDHQGPSIAVVFQRVKLVSRLGSVLKSIQPQNPSPVASAEVAQILANLGRRKESELWSELADIPRPTISTQQLRKVELTTKILEQLALNRAGTRSTTPAPHSLGEHADTLNEFEFADHARKLGIEFTYFESPDPTTEGRRMFEFTGGGVGALDYDLDGWPDLYFTQGTDWPVSESNLEYVDALYRNVGEEFVRVDEVCGIVESSMSQGVSVGDVNNDGFPDLYIANFGENQLYINNGDGTFDESSNAVVSKENKWTTSCAIADFDFDGIPDLYDVNYLEGDGLEEVICKTDGGPRVCTPLAFLPAKDRILMSSGNEHFVDLDDPTFQRAEGNGLGILVANLDSDPDLEVFVANDLMENFLWDRRPESEQLAYEQTSLLKGFAYGSEGEAQACMGIAAADFDHDTHIDLFVTNYFNESNSLYIVDQSGFAQDRSSSFGLRSPSLAMLGFGTQAFDADLDGDWDIVVANGDLDDFTHENRSFEMPAQFFENIDNKRFQERFSQSREDYFSKKYRGRGLAKVDWNRDGRCDFAVSHLDQPAALVTNLTPPIGEYISLKLIGTSSSRDAIGTKVTITSNRQSWRQQLTAGDGYQSSNERKLHFAITDSGPLKLTILWPSGLEQHASITDLNRSFIGIENRDLLAEPSHDTLKSN